MCLLTAMANIRNSSNFSLCISFLYDILHERYSSLSFNSFYNFKSSSKTSEATSCLYSSTTVYDQCLSVLFIFDNTLFIWNSIPHCILSLTKAGSFRKALRTYLLVFDYLYNYVCKCVYACCNLCS